MQDSRVGVYVGWKKVVRAVGGSAALWRVQKAQQNQTVQHVQFYHFLSCLLLATGRISVWVVDDKAAVSAQLSWNHCLVLSVYSIGALSKSVVFSQMFTKTDRTKHNQLIMLIASICSPAAVHSHFSRSQELVCCHSPCIYISRLALRPRLDRIHKFTEK